MNDKKKIIWHLPYAVIGGVETLYATILKYINKTDYEHYVTCCSQVEDWVSSKYKGLATVKAFNTPQDLSIWIEDIDPEVIIGTHGGTLYAALDLVGKKIKVIEVVHGSHVWVEHNVHMPKKYTTHVVCVSNSAERVYLENSDFGIPTSVIINGVDTEIFKVQKPLVQRAQIIAYFGRFLECDKHITKIMKAFKTIGSPQARLYLIGGTPQEVVSAKLMARKDGMSKTVKVFGHTSLVERYYKDVDVATVRSEHEGYCNSAAEALATGTPLVCYNFGGILDHLPPGAALVASTQAEYALMLRQIMSDYELRRSMREIGLKFIKDVGNAHIMAVKYEKLIASVIKGEAPTLDPPVIKSKEKVIPYVGKVSIKGSAPVVGVCHQAWHGIATATAGCTDVLVGWSSNPHGIMRKVVQQKPRAVLFSGMCQGFDVAARLIKKRYPEIDIYGYYHGGSSHFSFSNGLFGVEERAALEKMLLLNREGVFKKIACSYPGLVEVYRANGYKFEFTGNIFRAENMPTTKKSLSGVNIGNWNRPYAHKHTSAGFAAIQLMEGAILHTLEHRYTVPGLNYRDKVVSYSEMSQDQLYMLYRSMDVNLQLSFIETFNISVLEMWANKTPVLLGPGNYVLRTYGNVPYVEDVTNPLAIVSRLEETMKNKDYFIAQQTEALQESNKACEQRWEEFFA